MKKLLPVFLSLFLPLFARSAFAAAFSPLQIGVAWPDETAASGFHGFQLVSTNTPVIGLRLNLPASVNGTVGGLDMGIASVSETFSGICLNALSHAETVNGITLGLLDAAETLNGIQIGFLNVTQSLCGVQIGFANLVYDSSIPVLPFLRASF